MDGDHLVRVTRCSQVVHYITLPVRLSTLEEAPDRSHIRKTGTKQSTIVIKILQSVINTTFYSYTKVYYVRATCFDLVGRPQAFQVHRSKCCLGLLHLGSHYAENLNNA